MDMTLLSVSNRVSIVSEDGLNKDQWIMTIDGAK